MVEEEYTEIQKIKEYAQEYGVPIMQDEGIQFMTSFITKHQVRSILEVGTAIGYSAIMMALARDDIYITTIEKDEKRYLEALKNVKKFGLEKRITLLLKDANDVKLEGKYDLIFLDAAKGQNIHFFQNFEGNLLPGGYIITDNMNFHGYVDRNLVDIPSKNLRSLVRKIKDYHIFLQENSDYQTEFYSLGDGIAVSQKSR